MFTTNNFYYDKDSKIYNYDNSFTKDIIFHYELNNYNNCKLCLHKKKRFLINKDSINNAIYISTLQYNVSEDGIIISFNDYKVLLIPAGYNLYYLAYTNDKKIPLNCILYSFMLDNNCHIDITKYNYIYKGIYIILNTYKKA
jgi:hypothetical protein